MYSSTYFITAVILQNRKCHMYFNIKCEKPFTFELSLLANKENIPSLKKYTQFTEILKMTTSLYFFNIHSMAHILSCMCSPPRRFKGFSAVTKDRIWLFLGPAEGAQSFAFFLCSSTKKEKR